MTKHLSSMTYIVVWLVLIGLTAPTTLTALTALTTSRDHEGRGGFAFITSQRVGTARGA